MEIDNRFDPKPNAGLTGRRSQRFTQSPQPVTLHNSLTNARDNTLPAKKAEPIPNGAVTTMDRMISDEPNHINYSEFCSVKAVDRRGLGFHPETTRFC